MLKFLFVAVLVGVIVYLLVRAIQERGLSASPRSRAPRTRPVVPPRVVAPDDDEDFLRDLDRRRRLEREDPET